MQLIVFFNRETFRVLLENHGINAEFKSIFSNKAKNKKTGYFDTLYFNTDNPNAVIYIDRNGKPEVGLFEEAKAIGSPILMIPDNTQVDYSPVDSFFVLRHNAEPVMLKQLTENIFMVQSLHQNEEKFNNGAETLYYKLVLFIGNLGIADVNQFFTENNIHKNAKLEATLDFLKECFETESISMNTNDLIKAGLNIDCLKKKNIEDLSVIRKCLFEQCQIPNQSLEK